ncbi:MAG: hypothetical protein V3S07_08130 [Micropepsaceae bacterium]
MASQEDERRGQVDIAVKVSPEAVDAGAEMTLRAQTACTPSCDLRGHNLLLTDESGAEMGRLVLTEFDGERNESAALVVKAPLAIGDYVWSAFSPAIDKDGVSFDEASQAFSFNVKAHATRVLAWGAPSSIVAGEKFKMKIGIKCSSECQFANKDFAIYDHEGAEIASGVLSNDLWPGTIGLYYAEVELESPSSAGLYHWSAKAAGMDAAGVGSEMPHLEGETNFSIRVVDPPEVLVTIEAIDKISREPLAGARVALHPYKAVSNERGIAEIRVAKGAYTLFVAQTGYLTLGLPVDVTADMTASAELDLEPEFERN